jgi:hypothetical protein
MKSNYKLLTLIFALITLSFLGCKEDGLFGSGGDGDVVPRGEECNSDVECVVGADCNNGYCQCRDTTAQLRPGFCILRQYPNTFVTFDKHPEWVDTTMISFSEEPFDTDWSNVRGEGTSLGGHHIYFRRDSGMTWGSAGRLFRPDDPSVNADSIWITPIHTGRFSGSAFFNDGDWRCTKVFMGRFTDRDTIKGRLVFVGCRGGENTPLPDEVTNPTHEMTWVRLH